MQLDLAARQADMVFEQPLGGVEGLADRDENVFMFAVRCRIAPYDDLAAWNFDVDTHAKQIAAPLTLVSAFDRDAAGRDPIVKSFELLGSCANALLDRRRRWRVTEGNLKGHLHRVFSDPSPSQFKRRRSAGK
jgi:hypothetical protein